MLPNLGKLLALLSVAFLVAGCGEPLDPVYPVTGKVTLNGKPLTTGTVTFTPTGNGPSATGMIREDGTYELKSHDDRAGALPGSYKVSVSAVKINPQGMALSLLPSKYSTGQTSGLTAEVEEKDTNTVDIELTGNAN